MPGPRHVIVGAGTAGFNAITTLLSLDPTANVTLIAQEPPYARMVLPYYLSSEIDEANVYTISPERLRELGVHTLLGRHAQALDTAGRQVQLDSGAPVPYDDLLIATGSRAVRPPLPGIDGAKVYEHWTLADTQALRQVATPGAEVAIIGAGFIAFTIVNPLREAGCGVTLIEREPSVLPRMLDREGAGVLRHWMSSQGIHSFVGTELLSIEDDPRGRKRLLLKDQALPVEADVVIVATGIAPNVEWLKGSGLALNRGVLVDATLKTSDPSVYAAGDIAETLDPRTGQRGIMAIEVAAMEQGRIIGAAMAGRAHDYAGSMLMNVVETAGLQAASFGNWAGDDYTEDRAAGGHYRRYVWAGDTLTGGVIIGPARRMAAENDLGMLKGLIQAG
ncbi:MAG: NAD(P)/FAD-dependent oxidoreductase, partial [Chloroflexota bacterium]